MAPELGNKVFTQFGLPRFLHSDLGTDFLSNLVRDTCIILGVEKTATTPWHPQSDGMVERMNGTLGSMLRQYVNFCQDD